ncbi:hypothetical protein JOD43_004252 [Pullulanibacillus pueri]|nr:hypothetical protein [Pullulanibacillus pueri]
MKKRSPSCRCDARLPDTYEKRSPGFLADASFPCYNPFPFFKANKVQASLAFSPKKEKAQETLCFGRKTIRLLWLSFSPAI